MITLLQRSFLPSWEVKKLYVFHLSLISPKPPFLSVQFGRKYLQKQFHSGRIWFYNSQNLYQLLGNNIPIKTLFFWKNNTRSVIININTMASDMLSRKDWKSILPCRLIWLVFYRGDLSTLKFFKLWPMSSRNVAKNHWGCSRGRECYELSLVTTFVCISMLTSHSFLWSEHLHFYTKLL